ncbi:unnamed protein product, partial [Prorocentrum cordatum]
RRRRRRLRGVCRGRGRGGRVAAGRPGGPGGRHLGATPHRGPGRLGGPGGGPRLRLEPREQQPERLRGPRRRARQQADPGGRRRRRRPRRAGRVHRHRHAAARGHCPEPRRVLRGHHRHGQEPAASPAL